MKVISQILPKIGCHGPLRYQKRGPDRSSTPKTLSFDVKIAKIGPAHLQIICLQEIIKKDKNEKRKKLRRVKYIALSATLPSGQNDASNFVKFGAVTPELTEVICERQVRHSQETGVFSRISPDVQDQFSQSFHHMKALYVRMMDMYLIFQFVKGRCRGNQIMLREMRK